MSLFREEALSARVDRLHGQVVLKQPYAYHLLAMLMLAVGLLVVGWFAFGTYTRVETAPGYLVTVRPTAHVFAPRSGTVNAVLVAEGAEVQAGQKLVIVDVDVRNATGAATNAEGLTSVNEQIALAQSQIALIEASYAAQEQQIRNAVASADADIQTLESQVEIQQEIVGSQQKTFDRLSAMVDQGFMAESEYERRRQTMLSARQSMLTLRTQLGAARLQRVQLDAQLRGMPAATLRETTSARSAEASLREHQLSVSGNQALVISAPISGAIAALQTSVGQTVAPSVPLLAIVPASSEYQAEILAPSRAIGLLRPGQSVRLAFDSFPYQRFGTFAGRVQSVSRVALVQNTASIPIQLEGPAYKVIVSLDRGQRLRDGSALALQPGMTLTANFVLERRTFWEWLSAPLKSAAQRVSG